MAGWIAKIALPFENTFLKPSRLPTFHRTKNGTDLIIGRFLFAERNGSDQNEGRLCRLTGSDCTRDRMALPRTRNFILGC